MVSIIKEAEDLAMRQGKSNFQGVKGQSFCGNWVVTNYKRVLDSKQTF